MSSWRLPWSQIPFKCSVFFFIFRYVASAGKCTEQLAGVVNSTGRAMLLSQVQNQQLSFFPVFSTGLLVGSAKQIKTLIIFLQHICTCIAFWALSGIPRLIFNTDMPQKPVWLAGPTASLPAVLGNNPGLVCVSFRETEGTLRELPSWGLQDTVYMTVRNF